MVIIKSILYSKDKTMNQTHHDDSLSKSKRMEDKKNIQIYKTNSKRLKWKI